MKRAVPFVPERVAGVACACAAMLVLAAACSVRADEVKKDGKWHGNASTSLSCAAGNTRGSSLAVSIDAERHREDSKLSFYMQALGSRAESTTNGLASSSTTANQWKGGGRYDRNVTDQTFGFVALDLAHDRIQLLSLRSVASLGAGYHLYHNSSNRWDLLGGLTYRDDRYNPPGVMIRDSLRARFNTAQLLVREESSSKPTATTTISQRLVVMPNLGARAAGWPSSMPA